MSTVTVKSTGYGLRHKTTGHMACLVEEETDGNGYSNEYQYRLVEGSADASFRQFETETADAAALARIINTPWFNSTKLRPAWGALEMADYEVAEVVRVSSVTITLCDIPTPVTFGKSVEERKTMRKLAERYLGYSLPDEYDRKSLSFIVVAAPEGETLETLKMKCTNRPVLLGKGTDYPELCLGVFELAEEYQALFSNQDGVGLILTHFQF